MAAIERQVAEHFVGRDMVEPEIDPRIGGQTTPMVERGLQQPIGADDIGVDEVRRAVDRAVDMAFRREMHHRLDPFLAQQRRDKRGIGNVAVDKAIIGVLLDRGERAQ